MSIKLDFGVLSGVAGWLLIKYWEREKPIGTSSMIVPLLPFMVAAAVAFFLGHKIIKEEGIKGLARPLGYAISKSISGCKTCS